MPSLSHPPLGVIEGFFGRSWSWETRTAFADFFAQYGFNFYIYAPKSDAFLRKNWQQNWPADTKTKLHTLRNHYAERHIDFGIGLSPHEIYLDDNHDNRQILNQRIQHINELEPDTLCLLFDDMRGDLPDLARIQIELVHQAANISTAKRIIFCPTYYSFDPVLEKVFGKMPNNYFADLNTKLDKSIDIFWTGEKVCSPHYSVEHIAQVTDLLGRKPFLWDNYPVNDGAIKANYLHLRPVHQNHSQLQHTVAGHALNPMNEAHLSKLALASLSQAYTQNTKYSPDHTMHSLFNTILGEKLAGHIMHDLPLLQDTGLKNLSVQEKLFLQTRYSAFAENPFCTEILDWLNNGYEFDPACLTE